MSYRREWPYFVHNVPQYLNSALLLTFTKSLTTSDQLGTLEAQVEGKISNTDLAFRATVFLFGSQSVCQVYLLTMKSTIHQSQEKKSVKFLPQLKFAMDVWFSGYEKVQKLHFVQSVSLRTILDCSSHSDTFC